MDISIVILTWNSDKDIARCLDSIAASLHSKQHEIIVIDNGSNDRSCEILARYCNANKNISAIYLDHNTGTTYSRNLGLKQACGKYIAVMDSDMEVASDTFDQLIAHIESDATIGLVAPELVYGNGKLQKSTDEFPTLARKIYRYFLLKRLENKENATLGHSQPYTVDYAISAFWLFKHELLGNVGLLDEKFFYAPEDVDYCLRIWKAKLKIVFVPQAQAIHYAQEISRGFKINKAFREHLKGLAYYFCKHRYIWKRPRFY